MSEENRRTANKIEVLKTRSSSRKWRRGCRRIRRNEGDEWKKSVDWGQDVEFTQKDVMVELAALSLMRLAQDLRGRTKKVGPFLTGQQLAFKVPAAALHWMSSNRG